jgi:hypothetical protein
MSVAKFVTISRIVLGQGREAEDSQQGGQDDEDARRAAPFEGAQGAVARFAFVHGRGLPERALQVMSGRKSGPEGFRGELVK